MSAPALKQDFNMEAGLLSTREEERMMSKEALLPQDERPIQPRTRRTSPARRAAIAFAVCCLLGLGLISIGGSTKMRMMCPGHLRHGSGQEVDSSMANEALTLTKDAVFQTLEIHESLAKRQATSPNQTQTPADTPTNTPAETPSETPAETPSETPSNTAPNTPPTTSEPPVEPSSSVPPPDTTTNPTTSAPPPETTSRAPTTSERPPNTSSEQPPETTSEPAPTSSRATQQTSREPGTTSRQPSSSASPGTSNTEEVTSQEETSSPSPTSRLPSTRPPSSAADDDETSTAEDESRTPTQSTIYSGTKTTSKPVPKTLTSTLPNGGVTTLTSTSWVAIVPSAEATASGNPDLQNSAPRFSSGTTLSILAGAVLGGMLLM